MIYASLRELFMIAHSGGARISESSLRTQFGISSGPIDFPGFTVLSFSATESTKTLFQRVRGISDSHFLIFVVVE